MEHLTELDRKLGEFVAWMEREVVPTLEAEYQASFHSNVKANWKKAEGFKGGVGSVNPLVHAVIGPRCLKMYDDIKHVHHYLSKSEVPQGEIVRMDFFPRDNLIDDPERMFKDASRPHLIEMFQYFIDFGKLYYQYLKETDPVLMTLSAKAGKNKGLLKDEGPVDSK
jgi:hypothetical protein